MFTEQWLCQCGTSNSFLRDKCRDCDGSKPTHMVRKESPLEVISNVEQENEIAKLEKTFGKLPETK